MEGRRGGGKYTSHCCRRGAAQHWFLKVRPDRRWSLEELKWWGGWAQSETVCEIFSKWDCVLIGTGNYPHEIHSRGVHSRPKLLWRPL